MIPRIRLVPLAPDHHLAMIDHPERFEVEFGFPLAQGLAEYMVSDDVSTAWLADLRASAGGPADPWRFGFAMVHQDSAQVIGLASFKGAPDAEGVVEIAYGVAPGYEGRGYATEAARYLTEFALSDDRVRTLRAHTAPEDNPSTGVLRKCGFRFLGEVVDPEDGPVWRWELDRDPLPSRK
jgi:[ribosomal protein S5]-alanine N-acetyltransferase